MFPGAFYMSEEKFLTNDLNFVSYLISVGHKVISTNQEGRIVSFVFAPEVALLEHEWQFNPTQEMKLVQNFIAEKERILNFIKAQQRNNYGDGK